MQPDQQTPGRPPRRRVRRGLLLLGVVIVGASLWAFRVALSYFEPLPPDFLDPAPPEVMAQAEAQSARGDYWCCGGVVLGAVGLVVAGVAIYGKEDSPGDVTEGARGRN